MQNIFFKIVKKNECLSFVRVILQQRYRLSETIIHSSTNRLEGLLNELTDDIWVLIEHPYVDRTYRDTYYYYYSSKLKSYDRNSIRLSFFQGEIRAEHFRTNESYLLLQKQYCGFLLLRPTFPHIMGRSIINPQIFVTTSFAVCMVEIPVTVYGLKFIAKGFPHSSQDGEMLTCAETTLWSIMEYFGNKYADYKPLPPHLIHNILNSISHERLMPSHGLTQVQLSYAIKELGFGVRIYSSVVYEKDFQTLLKIYVESGIPIIVTFGNSHLGHAVNIIGREKVDLKSIDDLQSFHELKSGKKFYDLLSLYRKYVFIDDNLPPYKSIPLDDPAKEYLSFPEWNNCTIDSFIVPLYPKIYMEASHARQLSISILEQQIKFVNTEPLISKTFLTSSRSFKHYLGLNKEINNITKDLLTSLSMPKFIWITELSTFEETKNDLCSGLIVMDATEPQSFTALAIITEGKGIFFADDAFSQLDLSLHPFSRYSTNLI